MERAFGPMTVPMNASCNKFFPVPLSPVIMTVASDAATCPTFFSTVAYAPHCPLCLRRNPPVKQSLVGFLGADESFPALRAFETSSLSFFRSKGFKHNRSPVFHCLDRSLASSECGHENNHGRGSAVLRCWRVSIPEMPSIRLSRKIRFGFCSSRFDSLLPGIGGYD